MRSFYFFGYDSKLLRLGINEQVMSLLGHVSTCWSFCSLAGAVIVSAEAVCSFRWSCFTAKAVAASAGAVATCAEVVAASAEAVIGIFN